VALSDGRKRALLAAGLALLVVVVFAPVREHAWLNYDDDVYVTANPGVLQGLSPDGVRWAFTTFHGANWFPLTWLSWQANHSAGGLERQGYATTNLLLHALATVLLFLALQRMTGSLARSAFVAAVFGVHPFQVEPVAWIAARKDPLAGVFFMLALWVYAGVSREGLSARRLAGVGVCLALGLMSKQTVVTLPILLLLLDDWPLQRLRRADDPTRWDGAALRRCAVEKLPLLVLSVGAGTLTVLAQGSAGVIADVDRLPPGERVANALVSTLTYVGKALAPRDLAVFYPHPGALPILQVLGAFFALGLITAGALALARRHPAVTVGWLWFLVTLLPVIGLIQVGAQSMADRYMYLPIVGLAVAVAWGVPALLGHLASEPRTARLALTTVACLAIAGLSLGTRLQLQSWRDSETLMRHALAVTGANYIAHAHLGAALLSQGRTHEAAVEWRASARAKPSYATVANNLAWLLATHRDAGVRSPEEAVTHAERAAALSGDDPAVLDTLAAAYAAAGRFEEAVATSNRAARMVRDQGSPELARAIEERRNLYRRGRTWVEP
jgi:Tfp pilus assembly protein PilF